MSTTRRARAAALAVGVALSVGLTGCGVAGTSFQPGIAAKVDDQTVATDTVDELTSLYCEAITEQLTQENTIVPLSYFRAGVAGQLTLVEAAKQMADDYGVEATDDYDRNVSDIEAATTALTKDQQAAVIRIESSATYIVAVEIAVGAKLLAEEGVAEPGPDQSTQRGVEAFTEWLDTHDITINPEYGITLDGPNIANDDTSLSFAVGDTAKAGLADRPEPAYAGGLPDSQRCG